MKIDWWWVDLLVKSMGIAKTEMYIGIMEHETEKELSRRKVFKD